jgi:hypothetical protein
MRGIKVLAVVGLAVAFLISWSGYSINNLKCEIRDRIILGQKIPVLVFEGESLKNADVKVVVDPNVTRIAEFEGKTDQNGYFKIEITQSGVVNYATLPAEVTVTAGRNEDVGRCVIKDVREGTQAVPTLTEWGLIALAVLLAGSLAFMIRRRLAPRPAGA